MNRGPDIQSLLKQAGKNLAAIDQVAHYLYQRRAPLEPVLKAYKKYLSKRPGDATAAFNFAYYLSKGGQFEAAVEKYRQALRLGIGTPEEVHLNIANIYMEHLKNTDQAKAHLQKALKLNPDYASAYYNLGNLSEQEGERPEARRCFEQCLKFDPTNQSALARLADTYVFSDEHHPLMARLIKAAQNSQNSDLHFTTGRAYEQLAQFDMAWEHFTRANQIDRQAFPAYSQLATERVFHQIISRCSASWLDEYQGESEESVFICGMFRTGSTLLEQVLAAHPRFTAGGESEFFPRLVTKEIRDFPAGLANITIGQAVAWKAQHEKQLQKLFGGAIRVTDKRPDNFLHIGLIKAVLPSAKFIVTERHWRDIATSVYSTRLGPGQNYSTNLKDIRHYIDLQQELVNHWQSILGADLLRVRYEDIVTQPRKTITGLLEFLGEDWDEKCLSFNKLKNTVQTASVWQVREPLHTKSVGRWRNYQAYFDEAFGDDSN
jgi:tetratricopeptide (TPR) repeat protein